MSSAKGVIWVGNLPSSNKISSTITQASQSSTFRTDSINGTIPMTLYVSTVSPIADRLRATLDGADLRNVVIDTVTDTRLKVFVPGGVDPLQVANVLAGDPAVLHVEKRMQAKVYNKWSRGIIQNGLNAPANYNTNRGLVGWDNSLNGEQQIIGVSDTGIDMNHCFFSDGAHSPPFVAFHNDATAADFPPDSLNRRKVVQYVTFADSSDDNEGHGTHVSGTAAGYPESSVNLYSEFVGMAPQAKVAFFDIGRRNGQLVLPDDLTQMLQWAYVAGARIHSNSWGTTTSEYTATALDMDRFMYNNKDMLVVVAAGNDGSCDFDMTIGSPATAKNVISVGATMTNLDNYASTGVNPPLFGQYPDSMFTENNMAVFSSLGPTSDARIKPELVAPGFNTMSALTGNQAPNMCGSPASGVLTTKTGTSMATPAIAGNLALIRQYFVDGFYPTARRNASNSLNPSASLVKAVAIVGGFTMTGTRLVTDQFMANSPNQCPAIHFVSVGQSPGVDQGWGRLELSSALEFRSNPQGSSPFFLYVLGLNRSDTAGFADPMILQGQTHVYSMCVVPSALSNAPTKIALVWTDPPAAPGSGIQLVNDLDLEVHAGNATILGNAGVYQQAGPDRRNPVETVTIAAPASTAPNMDLKVIVRANAINVGVGQYYSLVVTGLAHGLNCQQIAQGVTDDKGNLTPMVEQKPVSSGAPASGLLMSTQLFAGILIAVAVVGGLLLAVVLYRVCRTVRGSSPA
ncbi:hypothetical protein PBRA_004585 [Plasmodiophora brassicae]|nr:hypothetical protein PBRA_004585 [Plasmodiophora brassicae]